MQIWRGFSKELGRDLIRKAFKFVSFCLHVQFLNFIGLQKLARLCAYVRIFGFYLFVNLTVLVKHTNIIP